MNMGLINDEVIFGPFQGMKFPPSNAHWISCRFEKLIGCYESELFETIVSLQDRKKYSTIVNPGAADGSFAIGLALLFPNASIYAFEASRDKLEVLKEMAKLNNCENRLFVGGWCDPESLSVIEPGEFPLVLCDVDGYEEIIMDPKTVPWLQRADIILELHELLGRDLSDDERTAVEQKHDCLRRDIGETIRSRFSATHRITNILQDGVPYENYPILFNLTMPEILAMTESDRPCIQNWFVMEAAPMQPVN